MTSLISPNGFSPQLAIDLRQLDDSAVITLSGEMDLNTEGAVARAVSKVVTTVGTTTLQLDVTTVSFIDSSGLRSLILARQTASNAGIDFVLRTGPDGPVRRRLQLSCLEKAFANDV
jgi:anti-sigma B factor antagonist